MEELLKLFANSNGEQSDISKLLPLFMSLMQNGGQKKDADISAPDLSVTLYEMYH